jgi:hypothetical protein
MIARTRMLAAFAAFGLIVGLVATTRGDDKPTTVTGTWTWTFDRNGTEIKNTLKIKQDGTKVTGKHISKRNDTDNEAEVKDGEFKDGVLKYTVVREFGGNSITIKYTGKLTGDVLKLEGEIERDGEKNKIGPWDAKLVTEKG